MKKISIITGTRAEYGLLKPLIKKIEEIDDFILNLIVTGSHLSEEFGNTYKEIENDGFVIDKKIYISLEQSTSQIISEMIRKAELYFKETKPDMAIVLGDRYEIFAVTTALSLLKIPISHLHGGETTEGATDEFFRHSITKMSYLHFVACENYRQRVIRMGEHPDRVFNVGAIGIESIKKIDYLSKRELEEVLSFRLDKEYAIMTYHPVTLDCGDVEESIQAILNALDKYDIKVIITGANADEDGGKINKILKEFADLNKEKYFFTLSLGQKKYFSALKYAKFVIGNSSSGLLEVPSFKIPTINIGDRQKGRIMADSIINIKEKENEIVSAIENALKIKCDDIESPFGDGNVSDKIIEEIRNAFSTGINLKKEFYDSDR